LNDFAWNKKANVLYLESPGGVILVWLRSGSAKATEIITSPIPMRPQQKITTGLSLTSSGSSPTSRRTTFISQGKAMPAFTSPILHKKYSEGINYRIPRWKWAWKVFWLETLAQTLANAMSRLPMEKIVCLSINISSSTHTAS
jgi:hypothetical protein